MLHQANQHKIKNIYIWEGVEVFPPAGDISLHFYWANRVLSHLEYTNWTIKMGAIYKRPVFHIVHGSFPYQCVIEAPQTKVIYNSQWCADSLQYKNDSIVLHPAVDAKKYCVNTDPFQNPYITLINLNENKGGKIFGEIAKKMPDKQFMAVEGSYEEQFIPDLPNVKVLPNSPNILPVYQQTKVLLMPSEKESWGMTATEAMSNGIPVIANPTPGLKENCGRAGIFVDRNDIDGWVKAIRRLDQKRNYEIQSKLCRERADELNPERELANAENFIIYGRGLYN